MADWVVLLERIEDLEGRMREMHRRLLVQTKHRQATTDRLDLLEREVLAKKEHAPTNADVKAWRDEGSKDTRLRDAEGGVTPTPAVHIKSYDEPVKISDEPIEPLPVFIPKIDLLDWLVAIERSAKQRPRAWSIDRVTEALRAKFEL